MPGPPPKDPDKRQRRNPEVAMTDLEGEYAPAPKLSREFTKGWHPHTREWWRTWASSPQGRVFTATDWTRLKLIIAPLVEQYVRDPKPGLAAEIRQQESLLGAVHMDRLRLRWRIAPADHAKAEKAAPKRRDPRLRVVGDDG